MISNLIAFSGVSYIRGLTVDKICLAKSSESTYICEFARVHVPLKVQDFIHIMISQMSPPISLCDFILLMHVVGFMHFFCIGYVPFYYFHETFLILNTLADVETFCLHKVSPIVTGADDQIVNRHDVDFVHYWQIFLSMGRYLAMLRMIYEMRIRIC